MFAFKKMLFKLHLCNTYAWAHDDKQLHLPISFEIVIISYQTDRHGVILVENIAMTSPILKTSAWFFFNSARI